MSTAPRRPFTPQAAPPPKPYRPPILTSTTDVAALILPWAKEHERQKYEDTVALLTKPDVFRRACLRLIEIRIAGDKRWAHEVPRDVLQETAVVLRYRRPDGAVWVVGGWKAPKDGLTHQFWELDLAVRDPERFALLQAAKTALDLVQL